MCENSQPGIVGLARWSVIWLGASRIFDPYLLSVVQESDALWATLATDNLPVFSSLGKNSLSLFQSTIVFVIIVHSFDVLMGGL